MSLATLANVKNLLGIASADTSQDTALTQWLVAAIALARRETKHWLGAVISGNSVASASVVTSLNHGLETGDTVVFYHSNSTPILDGARVVTRLSRDTFSVPVNVTVAGTAGEYGRTVTEYYGGDGTNQIVLNNRPVQSITSVYLDTAAYYGEAAGAFADSTLLTAGIDYCLLRDRETTAIQASDRGILLRMASFWPPNRTRSLGYLSLSNTPGLGSVKVTYTYGFCPLPEDIQEAIAAIVAVMKRGAKIGLPIMSESLDYYSYNLGELKSDVTSIKKILGRYKRAFVM